MGVCKPHNVDSTVWVFPYGTAAYRTSRLARLSALTHVICARLLPQFC